MTNDDVRLVADFIRTHRIAHGDQYGIWIAPSIDAERIADAVEQHFLRPIEASCLDPVPQADGNSDNSPTWVGEIDGKEYRGLGLKSGNLSHLPEGSH
jgi:hypothetical protein